MPSSTSSSKLTWKTNLLIVLVGLVGFGLTAGLGQVCYQTLPGLKGWLFTRADELPRESHTGHAVSDFLVYLHGLEGVVEPMRAAQVIFVGSSRAGFSFRDDFVTRFEQATGLKTYALGFPRSGMAMAEKLIQRYNLRPRVLVVAVDNVFFTDFVSHEIVSAERLSQWEAWRQLREDRLSWWSRNHLHRYIPEFEVFGHQTISVIYRNYRTGGWIVVQHPEEHLAVVEPTARMPAPERARAREFVARMRERGIEVVFTAVAGGDYALEDLGELARELDVPLLAPRLEGLTTGDPVHLDGPSARRFSDAFLEEFRRWWKG